MLLSSLPFPGEAPIDLACLLLVNPPLSGEEPIKAGETAPKDTKIEDCLICHGKPKLMEMSSSARRALLLKHADDADLPLKSDDPDFRVRLHVDPEAFLNSAHGKIKCMECHVDVTLPSHRPGRAPAVCESCHQEQYRKYRASRHFEALEESMPDAPDCFACHGPPHTMLLQSHTASPVHASRFVDTCGKCHPGQARTYARTYHGLFRTLGNMDTAQCLSCHENHLVLSAQNPDAATHPDRLGSLCVKCHENNSTNMAGFQAHLEPLKDRDNLIVFGTAWFMRLLIFGVLGFFVVHTLLYFARSLPDLLARMKHRAPAPREYRMRFSMIHRVVHLLIIVSFFGLCLTGFPLSFAGQEWAQRAVLHMGGTHAAGVAHRIFAGVIGVYAVLHILFLWRQWIRPGKGRPNRPTWFGPDSLLPTWRDFREMKDQWLWFFGLKARPRFGRWNYMEKFDYWAVFWGVVLIGGSGKILWFHESVVHFLPPWILNCAQIIHSEEAMLAVAYVFAIHLFHVHLRPATLPMDSSIFTGREPVDRIEKERPDLARRLEQDPLAHPLPASKASAALTFLSYLFGIACMILGIALLFALAPAIVERLFS
ncbi:MAG: hypothetical protein ABIK28_22405 [Planctomycetota bacterium]